MRDLIKRYGYVFLRSWVPAEGSQLRVSPQRILVLLVFWPVFLVLQLINATGLLLDDVLFPGYRKVAIRQPLFVVGVPRSGTTFLHRLLAGDRERFTTTALWELLFAPSITQRVFWRSLARLDRALGGLAGRVFFALERAVLGWLDDVHKTGLRDPEEDYLGLIPVWGCFLMVLVCPDPVLWQLTYFDRDAGPGEKRRLMSHYRRFVQRHLYFHGQDKTFLSKNPSFTPMLVTLSRAFPDARFIGCFRNPSQAVPSQVNSIVVGARLFDGWADEHYWRDGLMDMLRFYYRHLLETLPTMPMSRHASVTMEALAAQPQATIEAVYQRFGWTPSPAYRAYLAAEEEKAARYRSRHQYSLEGLAITPQRLVSEFGFVYDHFLFQRPC